MQVVPAPLAVQEERASYANPSAAGGSDAGDGWRTPERLAHFREIWKDTSAYFPASLLHQTQGSMSR